MTLREQLQILQHALQKTLDDGWQPQPEATYLGTDIILDPPSLVIRYQAASSLVDTNVYLDPLFPLLDREWAIQFWGNGLLGNIVWGALPAWKFHQHKLLEFLQNREQEEFYTYIALFL